ncbi:UDP-phosphate galactose phosphotransferase [Amycolatopsis sp. K13G38]|uniref:UDP-phosphate galactose phosphotransferase n=2 Tax=Amycolatopsis acididurans TaxID=2724524 RepID=A0ABX1J8E0_9PSEU|nr:UDP-phosphate galactose phosphotransferase [Amycolatopsis acididurans]
MPGWPTAGYTAAALAVLAAGRLTRTRLRPHIATRLAGAVIAAWSPVVLLSPWLAPGAVLPLAVRVCVALVAFRLVADTVLRSLHRGGRLLEPALVIGGGVAGHELVAALRRHPESGLRPARRVGDVGAAWSSPARAVLCCPAVEHEARRLREHGFDVWLAVAPDDRAVPRLGAEKIGGVVLVPLGAGTHEVTKRVFDLVVGTALLMLAAPVLVVLAALVAYRTGPPVLFSQVRVTGQGRRARILKLRTLPVHADADTRWAVPVEGCGRLCRWLRETHLDELTQLINVLRGELSLVGPRPERPYFVRRFETALPHYRDRQRMPAGITGWAQVNGLHGDTSIAERARFDNAYIDHWSLRLDVLILLRTLGPRRLPRGGAR